MHWVELESGLSEDKESFRLVMRGYYEIWGQAGTSTVILGVMNRSGSVERGM
jgi:hypothetical protein